MTTPLSTLVLLLLSGCGPKINSVPLAEPGACFERHVRALSADSMEGRGVGSPGLALAAEYIEAELARLGLQPGEQAPFSVTTGVALAEGNALAWDEQAAVVGEDFSPLGFSASGDFSGEVVFAGYGITAEELEYDD